MSKMTSQSTVITMSSKTTKAEGDDKIHIQPVKILSIDISHWSSSSQFFVCSAGVFVFYILYGYFQELIFTHPALKSHGLFVTFYQFVLYSAFGFIECKYGGFVGKKIPTSTYFIIGFLTVATMALSNASLEYLNFPTQVIFKSCKLIPVLIGGILIQGKKYGPVDFLAATIMCVGLIWFTLADSKVSPNFHMTGVMMISLALLADAVIGNVQEKAMKKFGSPNCEVVLYSYSIGLIYLAVALIVSGTIIPAVEASYQYPHEVFVYGFFFSLTGYLGVNIVLTLIRISGAFAAVTVTTFRKAFTIAISFLVFTKPFTMAYIWSSLLVLLGVYLNLLHKQGFLSPLNKIATFVVKRFGSFTTIRFHEPKKISTFAV